ncbi:MAG: putative membrane protein [Kiritimatiellia bacterium]|jgi:uncharacterized membrane protein
MQRVHSQLSQLGVYAVAIASGLTVALIAARWIWLGKLIFAFLVWNLFLAWVPFVLGLLALRLVGSSRSQPGVRLALIPLGLAWLTFLPNAPYMLTDLIHLTPRSGVPILFDAIMLGTAAATGLLIGGVSMLHMQRALRPVLGRAGALISVAATGPLIGLGIYLGRDLRWNTWDLLVRPDDVMWSVVVRIIDPLAHPRTWLVTLVCCAVVWVTWAAVGSLSARSTRWT